MFSGRITIVVASLLFLSQLQCMFQCAAEGCPSTLISNTQNVPPCHRHQSGPGTQKSAPCEHQIVASAAILPDAPQVYSTTASPVALLTRHSPVFSLQDFTTKLLLEAVSLPSENSPVSAVLRI
jgi:hypothetical protein